MFKATKWRGVHPFSSSSEIDSDTSDKRDVVTNLLVRSLNDTLYRLTLTGPFEDQLISYIRVTVELNQLLSLSESIAPAT